MTAPRPPQVKQTYWLKQHACPPRAATFTSPHAIQRPNNLSACPSSCTEVTPSTVTRTSYSSCCKLVQLASQNSPTLFPTIQPSSTPVPHRHDCSPASTGKANSRAKSTGVSAQCSHFHFTPCHKHPNNTTICFSPRTDLSPCTDTRSSYYS